MNDTSITEAMVYDALRQVDDPELGCNIVDLGLIYGVRIEGAKVSVSMTLTTPGCPMHETISEGARLAMMQIEGVQEAEVEVVWEPRWTADMMTEEGREILGMR